MPAITTLCGAILTLLGVGGYFGTGRASPTALIPALFGLALAGLGLVARNETARPHAMHGAAAIGLLGVLGTMRSLPKLATLIRGGSIERPAAHISQVIMAGICTVYVGLSVRSFVQARRSRRAAEHA